jgi:hypothetical protein
MATFSGITDLGVEHLMPVIHKCDRLYVSGTMMREPGKEYARSEPNT